MSNPFVFFNKAKWDYIKNNNVSICTRCAKKKRSKRYIVTDVNMTEAPKEQNKGNYTWTPIQRSGCFHQSKKL